MSISRQQNYYRYYRDITPPGRFERVLRAGKFAVTTELAPPDSADPAQVYERASVFDGYVDAINATDGSGANCHMSSIAVCGLLTRRATHPLCKYPVVTGIALQYRGRYWAPLLWAYPTFYV